MTCTTNCRPPTGEQCHCSTCHLTFRNLTGFDGHRAGGHCLEPELLGLVNVDNLWATPEGHVASARSASMLRGFRKVKR